MRAWGAHRFRRPTLVAVFCAALLIGTGLARIVQFDAWWALFGAAIAVPVLRKQSVAALGAFLLLGLLVGGVRGSDYMDKLSSYDQVVDKTVTLRGRAGNDSSYGRFSQVKFDIKNTQVVDSPDIALAKGETLPLIGEIGISGFGENVIFRGDMVEVTGKLRKGTGSKQGWMSFGKISVVARETSVIEKFRRKFGAGMQTALPEPAASFGMGILIGQNTTLPDQVYDDLLKVGLVHIIAVSGYNLTIIMRACMRMFGNRSKYQTTLVSVALICTFLLITGASASIVRASIVSLLSLAAWYYGRNFKPVTLILMAAAITCYNYPLYVWCDLGWYLSFLAFYGVMVLGPQMRYRMLPTRFRDTALVLIALESICAEIMALPLILYIFGQTSAIGLVANVAIAAFVPIAMLLSVFAGLAGMFVSSLAGWFAWPAVYVLTYMLDTAHLLASIPHIFKEDVYVSLTGMVGLYGLIVAFNLLLYSRLRQDRGIITALNDENTLLRQRQLPAVQK